MMFVKLKLAALKYIKPGTFLFSFLQKCLKILNSIPRLKGSLGVLPDFLIIGTQKGGTTSLYHYLIQHPDIFSATIKEIEFFSKYSYKSVGWYRSFFPSRIFKWLRRVRGKKFVTGEASTSYLFWPKAAERAAKLVPKAKIIILLRNPVRRAYSHYNHQVRKGRETLTFEKALDAEKERLKGERVRLSENPKYQSFNYDHFSYVTRGKYADQIKAWLDAYPREQVLIIKSEGLYSDPKRNTNKIFEFLGLPPLDLGKYHYMDKGKYKDIDEKTFQKLKEHFSGHNEELYDLIGKRFDWD